MEPGYYKGKIVTYKPDLKAVLWLAKWLESRKKMPLVKESMSKVIPLSLDYVINTELDRMAATPIVKYNPSSYGNDAAGYYSENNNGVAYKGNVSNTIRLHERTHSLRPTPLIDLISSFDPKKHQLVGILNSVDRWISDNISPSKVSKMYGGWNNYYNDPNEIYARLMLFRLANNINPNKVWTIDEIKLLRKSSNLKDFNIFDQYDDEFILKLFNEVAQNNNIEEDNQLLYAGKGTKLVPRKFRFR